MIGVQSNDAYLIMHDWSRRCRAVACGASRAVGVIHEKRYNQPVSVLASRRKKERKETISFYQTGDPDVMSELTVAI